MTPTEAFITLFFPWVAAILFIAVICGLCVAVIFMVFFDVQDAVKAWRERE